MYGAWAACTSEGGARGSILYIQHEGGTIPCTTCKNHETVDLKVRWSRCV